MPHTPGPWRVSSARTDRDRGIAVHTAEPDKKKGFAPLVAIVTLAGFPTKAQREEAESNARLIAAAPTLLSACEQFKWAFDQGEKHGGSVDWSDIEDAYGMACSALRKADQDPQLGSEKQEMK
jgi:hypothetical protein